MRSEMIRLYVKTVLSTILIVIFLCVDVFAAYEGAADEHNFPLFRTDTDYRMEPLLLELAQFDKGTMEINLRDYSDMDLNWAAEYIAKLDFVGVINGYRRYVNGKEEKFFNQYGNVKVCEFIKMVLCGMGYELENSPGYWAQNYIDKAVEENIISSDEFDSYERPILREKTAKIMVMAFLKREQVPCPNLVDRVRDAVGDYKDISDAYKHEVLQSYAAGLINGFPNGMFKPKGNLSRQEACTVIMRFLEPGLREPFIPEGASYIELLSTYGRTVRAYAPEGRDEYIDAAIALESARKLTKGTEYMNYASHAQWISASFFKNIEEKNRYLNYNVPADIAVINMGMDINIAFQYNLYPYRISIYDIDKVKQYHMVVVNEMFKLLFEDDYDKAWALLEECIEASPGMTENDGVEFLFNNRKGRIVYGGMDMAVQVKAIGQE
jgi:hypothetical protein